MARYDRRTLIRTASRVARALSDAPRVALAVGGDCTVGIGSVAGVQRAPSDVGVLYFDIHSDLNTPATAGDGLDVRIRRYRPRA
jgi:arginase